MPDHIISELFTVCTDVSVCQVYWELYVLYVLRFCLGELPIEVLKRPVHIMWERNSSLHVWGTESEFFQVLWKWSSIKRSPQNSIRTVIAEQTLEFTFTLTSFRSSWSSLPSLSKYATEKSYCLESLPFLLRCFWEVPKRYSWLLANHFQIIWRERRGVLWSKSYGSQDSSVIIAC